MNILPKKKLKNKTALDSLQTSAEGVEEAFTNEKSVRKQFIVRILISIFIGLVTRDIEIFREAIVFTMIILVAEMTNTCIERLCDIVQPNYDKRIKKIKDIAGGAVLIVMVTTILVLGYDITTHFLRP